MATTLSLVVIFVPVSFMSSVSGRFLYQFGITAAAAVLVSLLVSFTLTPMMSARLLRANGKHGRENDQDASSPRPSPPSDGGEGENQLGFEILKGPVNDHRPAKIRNQRASVLD